jgi:hypothetical protein
VAAADEAVGASEPRVTPLLRWRARGGGFADFYHAALEAGGLTVFAAAG